MANKKAETKRRVQNAGVKAGTIRVGAKGKSVRQWNAKTARWEKVSRTAASAAASMRATSQARQITVAKEKQKRTPSTSSTTPATSGKKISAPGTFTKSYERSQGGKETVPALMSVNDQRRRERARIALRKIQAKK